MSHVQYYREKLSYVIYALVTDKGRIKERLLKKKIELYKLLHTSGLPDELKSEWQYIIDKLTEKGPCMVGDTVMEDPILNTVKGMTTKQRSEIAGKLYEFFNYLRDID